MNARRVMLVTAAALALVAVVVLPARALGQGSVELLTWAEVPASGVVTLSQVARLEGPGAQALGGVVVSEDAAALAAAGAWGRLTVDTVRTALERAGADLTKVTLRGSACAVRVGGAPAPVAVNDRADRAGNDEPRPIDLSGPATVRHAVGLRLASLLGVEPAHVRVRFRDLDADVLNLSTAGLRAEVFASAGAGSSRIPLNIALYDGDRVVRSASVSVEVVVLREVAVAARTIDRREVLSPSDIRREARWVEPGGDATASYEDALGSATTRRIAEGSAVTRAMLEPPIVARRGDVVTVHCLSGTVVVRVQARAMKEARDGEIVRLKIDGSEREFSARMNGRGRAVMIVEDGGE